MSDLGHAGPQPTETTTKVVMASFLAVFNFITIVVDRISVAMRTG